MPSVFLGKTGWREKQSKQSWDILQRKAQCKLKRERGEMGRNVKKTPEMLWKFKCIEPKSHVYRR